MSNNYTKIEKVVVNVGLGRLSAQPEFQNKILPVIERDVAAITGQKPKTTVAKKAIAGFKTRTGQIIGLMTTLRGRRAKDFLERLIVTALPRVKDFRGIDLKNIDKEGHLNLGVKEHLVFPQINPEVSQYNFGLEVTVVVRGVKDREAAIQLYRKIGVPLKK